MPKGRYGTGKHGKDQGKHQKPSKKPREPREGDHTEIEDREDWDRSENPDPPPGEDSK